MERFDPNSIGIEYDFDEDDDGDGFGEDDILDCFICNTPCSVVPIRHSDIKQLTKDWITSFFSEHPLQLETSFICPNCQRILDGILEEFIGSDRSVGDLVMEVKRRRDWDIYQHY